MAITHGSRIRIHNKADKLPVGLVAVELERQTEDEKDEWSTESEFMFQTSNKISCTINFTSSPMTHRKFFW